LDLCGNATCKCLRGTPGSFAGSPMVPHLCCAVVELPARTCVESADRSSGRAGAASWPMLDVAQAFNSGMAARSSEIRERLCTFDCARGSTVPRFHGSTFSRATEKKCIEVRSRGDDGSSPFTQRDMSRHRLTSTSYDLRDLQVLQDLHALLLAGTSPQE
jgi:hypothetical protein